ncbi:MAG TPA: phage holin family protein [Devosia sp.]
MSYSEHSGRPITDLLGSLVSDISGLFRKEIELAKAEAGEKVDEMVGASRNLAIGGVLAIGAVGVFLTAIVTGLGALLMAMGMGEGMATFLSALAVAVVVGGIAWMLIQKGVSDMRATKLNMKRTTRSVVEDAQVVKESF